MRAHLTTRRTTWCAEQHAPSPLLSVSVVAAAADIGQAPAPPCPDPLIAAVVVAVRIGSGEGEEPVVEPVVPEGKPGMSHADTRKRAGVADSGAAKPRTHASKATGAHADVTHPTAAHASAAVSAHPTHPGRRVKRRTGDDGRRRGQGDHYF